MWASVIATKARNFVPKHEVLKKYHYAVSSPCLTSEAQGGAREQRKLCVLACMAGWIQPYGPE